MSLNAGDKIIYCLVPGMKRYHADVLSIDHAGITLRVQADSPDTLPQGQYVMISEPIEDIDYYCEVIAKEGPTLRLRRVWTGKRGYFRVDDVFPVLYTKVPPGAPGPVSRIYSGYSDEGIDLTALDEQVSPRLWKMLVDINSKLGLILERLHLESEGLTRAESIAVNISASGIRFASIEKFALNDVLEVKMLLPTNPALGLLAHGKVVRVDEAKNGAHETSLHFLDLVDDVRDVIIQYTLKRQREVVRRHREQHQGA